LTANVPKISQSRLLAKTTGKQNTECTSPPLFDKKLGFPKRGCCVLRSRTADDQLRKCGVQYLNAGNATHLYRAQFLKEDPEFGHSARCTYESFTKINALFPQW
jgi:hypothetical protein